MNTQSMGLHATAVAFSRIGAVYADRLELNKQKNATGSLGTEVLMGSSV